jgi:hypothetical protein
VSLAHHGVLFLDELAEFRRDALEAMRHPIEEGRVTMARAADNTGVSEGTRSLLRKDVLGLECIRWWRRYVPSDPVQCLECS